MGDVGDPGVRVRTFRPLNFRKALDQLQDVEAQIQKFNEGQQQQQHPVLSKKVGVQVASASQRMHEPPGRKRVNEPRRRYISLHECILETEEPANPDEHGEGENPHSSISRKPLLILRRLVQGARSCWGGLVSSGKRVRQQH